MTPDYKLRPSAAACWVLCAGMLSMVAGIPADMYAEDEVTQEGTAAHWFAKRLAIEGIEPRVGESCPENGITADAEMIVGVREYVAHLRSRGLPLYVEQHVPCTTIHPQCGGTPDCFAWDAPNRVLYVDDFKYGFRPVEVRRNWQLLCYAAGILDLLGASGLDDQHITVVFGIHQPRSYNQEGALRTWSVKASDLRGDFNILRMAAAKALANDPTCTTNEYCEVMPCRHTCKAYHTLNMRNVDYVLSNNTSELTPAALNSELALLHDIRAQIEGLITGREAEVKYAIRQGAALPGWGMEQGKRRESWRDDASAAQAVAIGRALGLKLWKPMTPTQMRAEGVPEDLVSRYAHRPPGEMKLVRMTETKIRKLFERNS